MHLFEIEDVMNTLNEFIEKSSPMKDDYYIVDPRQYKDIRANGDDEEGMPRYTRDPTVLVNNDKFSHLKGAEKTKRMRGI